MEDQEPPKIVEVSELDAKTQRYAKQIVELLQGAGLNAKVIETYRTPERQNYLYASGRSRKGKIVTKTKNSSHSQRKAFDIGIFGDNGEYLGDASSYMLIPDILSNAGIRNKITWGGDWNMRDYGHFETPQENIAPVARPKQTQLSGFKQAFRNAVNVGLPTFEYNGELYTTEMK